MSKALSSLTSREKILIAGLLALVVGSVLYHNHPHMDGLQEQLETKAPVLFKLFVIGEGVYFGGMVMMALGLGKSLGPNLATWPGKLKEMMESRGQALANAKIFWFGFVCNVIGSLTFGAIGLYVAAEILPGGSKTLIPASMVDMGFSLFARLAFYRRFRTSPEAA